MAHTPSFPNASLLKLPSMQSSAITPNAPADREHEWCLRGSAIRTFLRIHSPHTHHFQDWEIDSATCSTHRKQIKPNQLGGKKQCCIIAGSGWAEEASTNGRQIWIGTRLDWCTCSLCYAYSRECKSVSGLSPPCSACITATKSQRRLQNLVAPCRPPLLLPLVTCWGDNVPLRHPRCFPEPSSSPGAEEPLRSPAVRQRQYDALGHPLHILP